MVKLFDEYGKPVDTTICENVEYLNNIYNSGYKKGVCAGYEKGIHDFYDALLGTHLIPEEILKKLTSIDKC